MTIPNAENIEQALQEIASDAANHAGRAGVLHWTRERCNDELKAAGPARLEAAGLQPTFEDGYFLALRTMALLTRPPR